MKAMPRSLVIWLVLAPATGLCLARTPSLEDRIEAQRAIEGVFWRHRTWPAENASAKPALSTVMPEGALRARVEESLDRSRVLSLTGRPITGSMLQGELERMASHTHDPKVLAELFDALHRDPELIAETLVRQVLAEKMIRDAYEGDVRSVAASPAPSFEAWWAARRDGLRQAEAAAGADAGSSLASAGDDTDAGSSAPNAFTLPPIPSGGCTPDTWSPTHYDVPDPRTGHTAVWTGTEMIVWGGGTGTNAAFPLPTGGRYNPSTDSWSVTSTSGNAPSARSLHTAVWTGTVMIVWGGLNSNYENTGARYDPTTDTWTPTSTGANVPSGRRGHTAVWTGSEMIVWGGTTAANVYTNTGGRYDPSTDTWTATSTGTNVPAPRYVHTAVWSGTQMIVWGGFNDTVLMNTGGRYTPSSNSWTATSTGANVPVARRNMSVVWTGTQMIVWGGITTSGSVNTGGRYTPSSNSWTATSTGANVPLARFGHAAVWTGSRMVVWGGDSDGNGGRYDPATNTWLTTSTGAGKPVGRVGPTAVWTGTEMIVWGGGQAPLYNTGGRYNPTTDSWVPTSQGGAVPSSRALHTAVWTGAEMIVWGGGSTSPDVATGGRYYPSTDSWLTTSTGAGSPAVRPYHTAVWTGREMIVWGGVAGGVYLNTGGRYDPATDTWHVTSTGAGVPSGRYTHSSVWTGVEMIVWGGFGNGSSTNTGGRYDPRTDTWTPTSVGANVPSARLNHSAVWTGTEMIVWGGGQGATPGTGGRYDPSSDTWLATSTTGAPEDRVDLAAVWTGSRMIVWGGRGGQFSIPLGTGGLYDPVMDAWTPTAAGVNVLALTGPIGVWTGDEMIVWGGEWTTPENVGHRYDPAASAWHETSMGSEVPRERRFHTGVWTGTHMIVWGGDPETSSGALYCACPSGILVYRDSDGDGHGEAGGAQGSCDGSVPAGYVTNDDDCNDRSGSVHPGAAELCNAVDDDCDGSVDEGIGAPTSVPALTETKSGSSAVLAWPAAADATGYDVVRGDLQILHSSGGDFTASTTACLADGLAGTTVSDPALPAPGGGWWHLVRPVSACGGNGTFDEGSASQQGSRDTEIQASAAACP